MVQYDMQAQHKIVNSMSYGYVR